MSNVVYLTTIDWKRFEVSRQRRMAIELEKKKRAKAIRDWIEAATKESLRISETIPVEE